MKDFIKFKRKALISAIKQRAKRKDIPFNLGWTDLIYPQYCPVLGIELVYGDVSATGRSPSVDRIDNSKGYTKDNIIIVSQKANRIKNNATVEELKKVYEFYANLKKSSWHLHGFEYTTLGMIIFKGKKFKDYVDFFVYCVKQDMIEETWFPHTYYFCSIVALEEKFNRKFSMKEIKQLVKEELALKTITWNKEVSQSNVSC